MYRRAIPKPIISTLLIPALLLVFLGISLAQEKTLPILNTEIKTVAVFKNNLAYVVRDGKVIPSNGWAVTENVPDATIGSLWIGLLDSGAILNEAIALREETEKSIKMASIKPSDIIIVNSDDSEIVLSRNNFRKIEFPNGCNARIISSQPARKIKFKVASPTNEVRINLAYLQKGISWVPCYLVNIDDPKKARITMQANLINDAEDLENVDIYFIVGYPNFKFSDILSPMALGGSIGLRGDNYSRGPQSGSAPDISSQIVNSDLGYVMREAKLKDEENYSPDYGYKAITPLAGANEEDLFLYNKKGINLKNGERAYYNIFSDMVDYKHLYEWKIPDMSGIDQRGYQQSRQEEKVKEPVWHSLKLTNSTAFPWTTAPAFTISGWKPLAQDIMEYTPKNGQINLKLTIATDVKTDRHETEIGRQRDVIISGDHHDLVTVRGELYIRNFKTKEATIEIKKVLTGEVINTSHGGQVKKTAEGIKGVNSGAEILWDILLKAGEEATVTYEYKIYVRT
ncbi:MAG: hypothetical protein NTV06_08930 [candidate division Zixibacteria bacterium]|nr:hypothetical protein [candidate division Zixibacteria bacterium]